ncbi:MAG: bifunctional adenosylcobinamide kinase/adenosylcobinamide-phosphate guanylyltransferase [Gammaproteobacteria bacterium]
MKHLILGGARSGKSRLAEQQATASAKQVIYIATAHAGDEEMAQRIHRHQQQRPEDWLLVEQQLYLADSLLKHDSADHCLLVDCLTLWLCNLLCLNDEPLFKRQRQKFLEVLPQLQADVLLVSNEVGQGIVPEGELNRRFIDESGWLHQAVAEHCTKVSWVMAGLPMSLKG